MKRYQILKYCDDCGLDEGMDYDTQKEAIKKGRIIRKWEKVETCGIYDAVNKICTIVYGNPYDFYDVFTPSYNVIIMYNGARIK